MSNLVSPLLEVSARTLAQRLQDTMVNMAQERCVVKHYFPRGLYIREAYLPRGVVAVGAVHKQESWAKLIEGKLKVLTEEGTKVLLAPCTFHIKAGQKNAVLALEDSVFQNFHDNPDNETDLNILTERFTESTAAELIGGDNNAQMLGNREGNICLG